MVGVRIGGLASRHGERGDTLDHLARSREVAIGGGLIAGRISRNGFRVYGVLGEKSGARCVLFVLAGQ